MVILTVEWHKIVLSSTVYNFKTDSSSISKQAIFNSNFSRNVRVCLDISFSRQLVLRGCTRVIYTHASPIYCNKIDIAYN